MLDDHGEQVLAAEAGENFGLIWDAGQRIRGIHEQRFDWRMIGFKQPLTESLHVERASGTRAQIVAPERSPVETKKAARVIEGAAPRIPPVAGNTRDRGDRPHCHAASAVTLKTDADANPCGAGVREALSQLKDRFSSKAGNLGRTLRRKIEDPLMKSLIAQGVIADELAILLFFLHHDIEETQGERGIASRHRRQMPVTRLGGSRADGIDGDDKRAIFSRLKDRSPQVGMG